MYITNNSMEDTFFSGFNQVYYIGFNPKLHSLLSRYLGDPPSVQPSGTDSQNHPTVLSEKAGSSRYWGKITAG